jgi:hypothetical protein
MSSLLEQAIVDAAALKEAALKNAQQTLLDKYSDVIKEAMDTLLEAEEDPLMASPDATPAAAPAVPAADPAAGAIPPPNQAAPADPMAGMPPADSGADGNDTLLTSPDQETTAFGQEKIDRTFDNVPFSWIGNSNEKVRIDFTSLEESLKMEIRKKTEEDMLIDPDEAEADRKAKGKADALEESEDELEEGADVYERTNAAGRSDVSGPDSLAFEELEEEYESDSLGGASMLDEEYGCEDELEETAHSEEATGGLGIVAEEEDLEELEEMLVVDLEPSPQGYMGFSPQHHREQEHIKKALAAAEENADKSKKKTKDLQEALENITASYIDLKEKLKNSSNRASKLTENNKKLTESLQNMVISNAKLLYTNKVLGNPSLNERQKQSLVETISQTNNVEKIKAIFETLQSGTQSVRRTPESLSEAALKGNSPFLTRRNPQPLVENAQVERFQILAGIKKSN